ncbi:hypothetical protein NDN08_000483 [Rhodosorus marinus]|uniref:Pre-mRNA-splicing factor 18 n=1 Tax=Rhodosorus marinus TaxID=101924 RepID=A0AAV8US80_9RHOD|nr:hypothetical protein NDN08_000483 [Rhodosorus marinus]
MSLGLLKAEIELKKKARMREDGEEGEGRKKKKWFRRGDLEGTRRGDAEEKGGEVKKNLADDVVDVEEKGSGPEIVGERAGPEKTSGNVADAQGEGNAEENIVLSRDEVIRRLRSQGEPATLFGESNLDRYRRLKEVELKGADVTKGQRNVYQMKMREMKGMDEGMYLKEDDVPARIPPTHELESRDEPGENPKTDEDYVRGQINKLMAKWKEVLDNKPADEKRTQKGRKALATYEQSKEYLEPLEKKLKKRELGLNVLHALKQIFQFVEEREYVQANDVYLKLAIGNAPWPMGATMVGIHARTAREKIGEGKIAHVMNDEQTRKYIQAVKRLITMTQSWSPTVPSKMISS